jgi:hypothetical protein
VKPPRCRVCDVEHWGSEHVFPGTPSRVTQKAVKQGAINAPRAEEGVSNAVSNKDAARVRRWRAVGPNRDRYNEQQRERMRARRAAGRVS